MPKEYKVGDWIEGYGKVLWKTRRHVGGHRDDYVCRSEKGEYRNYSVYMDEYDIPNIKVKAIIKRCSSEGGDVCYFKSGPSLYKMTGKRHLRKLTSFNIRQTIQGWGAGVRKNATIVYENENVLIDGEVVHLTDNFMKLSRKEIDFLEKV